MATRKKYKLRFGVKLIIFLIIVGVIGFFVYDAYQKDLAYKNSHKYKLLQKGYKEDIVNLFMDKLTDEQEEDLLTRDYDEFIPFFVNAQYFKYDNLDLYLEQVITKEKDFFKYHGTDGYDYDLLVGIVNTHANEENYSGNRKSDLSKGYGVLVNKHYSLDDYTPDDLESIPWKYRLGMENDKIQLRKDAYDAYLEMWEAAYEEDIYLLALSGYRSKKEQQGEYDYYYKLKGEKYAENIAARAGHSEHQTGLALDIYSKECALSENFHKSKSYEWLVNNSYKYGYILRYPEGKEKITGFKYESWHYRYLGVELATKVHESGLTYDEYYEFYLANNNE